MTQLCKYQVLLIASGSADKSEGKSMLSGFMNLFCCVLDGVSSKPIALAFWFLTHNPFLPHPVMMLVYSPC